MGYKGKKVIEKLGQDGTLYSPVDVPDGEYNRDQINARVAAQQEQFVEQYQTTSMGPGDKVPDPNPKATPAVVVKY